MDKLTDASSTDLQSSCKYVLKLGCLWVRGLFAFRPSTFCGFAIRLQSDTAKRFPSKPQFCGFAARSHVEGCTWLGVGSNRTSFKLVRFWVSCAVMSFKAIICWVLRLNPLTRCLKLVFLSNSRPQTHVSRNFAVWGVPQTHRFSNFAAFAFS